MKILRAYGIPARIVQSISDVYDNTSAKVLTPDGETDTFPILASVLQGDTLAPYLHYRPRLRPTSCYYVERGTTLVHNHLREEQTGQASDTDRLRLRR